MLQSVLLLPWGEGGARGKPAYLSANVAAISCEEAFTSALWTFGRRSGPARFPTLPGARIGMVTYSSIRFSNFCNSKEQKKFRATSGLSGGNVRASNGMLRFSSSIDLCRSGNEPRARRDYRVNAGARNQTR